MTMHCIGVSGRDGGDGDGEGRGDQGHCWGDQRKGLFLSKQNDGKVFCKKKSQKRASFNTPHNSQFTFNLSMYKD